MQAPVVVKEIPAQVTNERAAYGPIDLNEFIQAPDGAKVEFSAGLDTGESLPLGLICTSDGILTGIAGVDTEGSYTVILQAKNEAGDIQTEFSLTIQASLADRDTQSYQDELKTHIWQALDKNAPLPDLSDLLERGVSPLDIYYLLERWATLTIYDAFNLDPPGEKKVLTLKGVSEHYNVYDRGCCLVATPKDLYSHERTLADGIQAAQALAREAYKREWTVELIGFEKLTRAAWVEIQHLGDEHNRKLEVINYDVSTNDILLYDKQAQAKSLKKG